MYNDCLKDSNEKIAASKKEGICHNKSNNINEDKLLGNKRKFSDNFSKIEKDISKDKNHTNNKNPSNNYYKYYDKKNKKFVKYIYY